VADLQIYSNLDRPSTNYKNSENLGSCTWYNTMCFSSFGTLVNDLGVHFGTCKQSKHHIYTVITTRARTQYAFHNHKKTKRKFNLSFPLINLRKIPSTKSMISKHRYVNETLIQAHLNTPLFTALSRDRETPDFPSRNTNTRVDTRATPKHQKQVV